MGTMAMLTGSVATPEAIQARHKDWVVIGRDPKKGNILSVDLQSGQLYRKELTSLNKIVQKEFKPDFFICAPATSFNSDARGKTRQNVIHDKKDFHGQTPLEGIYLSEYDFGGDPDGKNSGFGK